MVQPGAPRDGGSDGQLRPAAQRRRGRQPRESERVVCRRRKRAEEGGLAVEIARCLADLVALPTATVSVLLGEGGELLGGGGD